MSAVLGETEVDAMSELTLDLILVAVALAGIIGCWIVRLRQEAMDDAAERVE